MGKFPFIAEHVAFDKEASFLLIAIIKWENSHKNGKFPMQMGKFPFIAEHVAFDREASILQIPIKMGKFL
jgi:hypothetical protein